MVLSVDLFPSKQMMYEALDNGKDIKKASTARRVSWKTGEKNPFRDLQGTDFIDLINCQGVMATATRKELILIRTHLKGIPWPISSIEPVYWFDEHAKFIALNFEF